MKLSDIVKIAVCTCCDRRYKEINYIKNICKITGLEVKILVGGNGENKDLCYDFIDDKHANTFNIGPMTVHTNQYNFHKIAIKWAYENELDNVLFLEDDITLTKDFWDVLSRVEVPEDYDQINIGGFDDGLGILNSYDTNSTKSPYLLKSNHPGGFFGSIIRGRNLKYLYEETHYDGLPGKQYIHDTKFIHYILQPPVVIERDMVSIIHNIQFERGIYKQALRENRLFLENEIYEYNI